jgi:hypothetical protein
MSKMSKMGVSTIVCCCQLWRDSERVQHCSYSGSRERWCFLLLLVGGRRSGLEGRHRWLLLGVGSGGLVVWTVAADSLRGDDGRRLLLTGVLWKRSLWMEGFREATGNGHFVDTYLDCQCCCWVGVVRVPESLQKWAL